MRIVERYELAKELRDRYWAAGRSERGLILDAFCLASGYNRKYAMGMLRSGERKPVVAVQGLRRRRYGLEFRRALAVFWEASGHICAERLQPFIPDLLLLLERHRQISLDAITRELILEASISTIERNLVSLRRGLLTRKMSQTKPGTLLRRKIPVIVGRWREL
ncbi:MAG: hypothetical protein ACREN8_11955, partial [Candidatus Dormibacteraceae bacterium]